MSLQSLQNSKMYIQSKNGSKTGPYRCAFSNNNVITFETSISVEEGDKILRSLPNGKEESFTVLETSYNDGLRNTKPFWKLVVRKDTSLKEKSMRNTTSINIHNSQGIQVGDHNTQRNVANSFETLISIIEESNYSEQEKTEAKNKLKEFISHPLVSSILGSVVGNLMGLL